MRRLAAFATVLALVAPTTVTPPQHPDGIWLCIRHPRQCL